MARAVDERKVARALAARAAGASQRNAGKLVGVSGPAVANWERRLARGQMRGASLERLLAAEKRRLQSVLWALTGLSTEAAEAWLGQAGPLTAILVASIATDAALQIERS